MTLTLLAAQGADLYFKSETLIQIIEGASMDIGVRKAVRLVETIAENIITYTF